jgi:hypothetical protein
LFERQTPEQQSVFDAQFPLVLTQQTPLAQVELNRQSRTFVHAPPFGVGAQPEVVHDPEQHSALDVHAPLAPIQHVRCAVQRPNWASQQSLGVAHASLGRAQQFVMLQYRGAQHCDDSRHIAPTPPHVAQWSEMSHASPVQHCELFTQLAPDGAQHALPVHSKHVPLVQL